MVGVHGLSGRRSRAEWWCGHSRFESEVESERALSDRRVVIQIESVLFRRNFHPIRIIHLVGDALYCVAAHPDAITWEVQSDFIPERHRDGRLHHHGILDKLGLGLGQYEILWTDLYLHLGHAVLIGC